ncbi:DUF4489 domain-containing protein [Clostridium tyrobutyricum]|uniref:DUF4489 domain-containing protein n=1 Tax=Clostridium tyrobutyricum TaxID=1519 RepID=UPI00057CD4E5|nr:DUF4489 domain-containing protein [Clostridium tyrobutyricum]
MNSMSKYYRDDCDPCKNGRKDYYDDYDKHYKKEKDCQTIVKCGFPSATTIPATAAVGDTFTLTSLNLNTAKLKDPCVKLEFASNIIAAADSAGVFSVQVFKQCGRQVNPTPVGPAWTLGPTPAIGATFSFFVCDCDDSCFDDCCTYTVVATTTVANDAAISVNNATLGAIAACGNGCH